jgi:hypothetical protein
VRPVWKSPAWRVGDCVVGEPVVGEPVVGAFVGKPVGDAVGAPVVHDGAVPLAGSSIDTIAWLPV